MRIIVYLMFMMVLCVCAQNQSRAQPLANGSSGAKLTPAQRKRLELVYMPPQYQKEALAMTIREANDVARKLNLQGELPITESNLVGSVITPPRMAKIGFGNVTTSNYIYYVSVGDKFSSVVQTHSDHIRAELQQKYLWPISQMDTNAAYQLATQWLTAVSMDVKALDRDGDLHIDTMIPKGEEGKHFVPIYWVYWTEKNSNRLGTLADVELILPTKTLQQLRVEKSEYILRPSLRITNIDLTLPTNVWTPEKIFNEVVPNK